MVQRKSGQPWVVAGKGYIITNIKRSGGKVLPLSPAI
ncbi:hypothetical protein D478_05265 [Brevibacillus agri BAB-2500]|nr:hypothetical protein D478_05265 [Brevibacillus agri BAB-2500]